MTQANDVSQQLVDKNNKMMEETKQLLEDQRKEIAEIGMALKELGIDIEKDLPLGSLSEEQQTELNTFKAEIERISGDLTTSPKSGGVPSSRRVKVMI
ncbi:MAG: hypothetical protein MI749_09800 [Desulfovibrionales bacterium]|nr:hypothetical protein [Desulfovibrionales bacterium]